MTATHLLVTGAASGIGRATVTLALVRGYAVTACDHNEAGLRDAARADGWAAERCRLAVLDVRDPSAWGRVVAEAEAALGPIEILLNVAGVLQPGWVWELDAASVDHHLDVNVKGPIHGMRWVTRSMLARGSGHVINVASLAGVAPIPGLALYSASKFALRAYSLAAAYELAAHGVAVTVVCPDAVETPMLEQQEAHEQAALTFSGPRPLTAHEVAHAMLGPVLRQRPLEYVLPLRRGLLAKFAGAFPALARLLIDRLRRRGRAVQRARSPRGAGA